MRKLILFILLTIPCFPGVISTGVIYSGVSLDTNSQGAKRQILCLGDSITYGTGDPNYNSYRASLQDLLTAGGIYCKFIGIYENGDINHQRNHSGVAGNTTAQLLTRLTTRELPMLDTSWTTYVLIHIGINDYWTSVSTATAAGNMQSIIDAIREKSTDIKIFVSLIFPSTDAGGDTWSQDYNSKLVTLITTYPSNVYAVDQYGAFTANVNWKTEWMNDESHPNALAYRTVMAPTFYNEISEHS